MSDSDPSPGDSAVARDDTGSVREKTEPAREQTDPARDDTDSTREPADDEQASNTLFNALIGGLVTAITAFFVPLSPVLGGGIAGYLEGGETGDGLRVGALSGLFSLLPLFFIGLVALFFVGVLIPPRGAIGIAFLGFLVVIVGVFYTVGLGAIGGAIGIYVKNEL